VIWSLCLLVKNALLEPKDSGFERFGLDTIQISS